MYLLYDLFDLLSEKEIIFGQNFFFEPLTNSLLGFQPSFPRITMVVRHLEQDLELF